ncbi:MAG: hypothetical protein WCS70_14875, partial [Verrucomicrobiota bacterium]
VQKTLDHVTIRLVITDRAAADAGQPRLRAEVCKVLGAGIQLNIEYVTTIPLNATGKHRPVISEIPVRI